MYSKRSLRKMVLWSNINEDNCKNWFQAFSFETKEASASYCPSTMRPKRAGLIWNFVKSGTQKGEIVFPDENIFTLETKFNSQNDRVLTQHSEDVPEDMLTVYRRQKSSYVMAEVSKLGNLLWFFLNKVPKSTKMCTSMIFWPLPCMIRKNTSKMIISPSNRTVLPLTPPIKPKLGAKTISFGFGASNCGLLHRPISTQ